MGVQLYTVNAELEKDVPGTLKAVKEAGYDVVETAGTFDRTAREFKALIDASGLTARSAHTNMKKLRAGAEKEVADAAALGVEWLICSSPIYPVPIPNGVDPAEVMTADAWKINAEHLARFAAMAQSAGLKFGYHNHHMEFRDLGDGTNGFDILMTVDGVRAELDLGWVAVAGHDPVAAMRKYAARLDLLHVKDMVRDAGGYLGFRSTEIGHGVIDWKPVFAAARELGVKQYFIEQEPPFLQPAIQSLKDSRAYIASL